MSLCHFQNPGFAYLYLEKCSFVLLLVLVLRKKKKIMMLLSPPPSLPPFLLFVFLRSLLINYKAVTGFILSVTQYKEFLRGKCLLSRSFWIINIGLRIFRSDNVLSPVSWSELKSWPSQSPPSPWSKHTESQLWCPVEMFYINISIFSKNWFFFLIIFGEMISTLGKGSK